MGKILSRVWPTTHLATRTGLAFLGWLESSQEHPGDLLAWVNILPSPGVLLAPAGERYPDAASVVSPQHRSEASPAP